MGSRALGAFLALAAAAAFVVSIVMSTWWAGNPVVDGKLIEAKYVSVGPLFAQGCNVGGDGSCSAVELDQQTQLIAYGELGAAGLATLFLLMLVGAAWRVSDGRKGLSTASLLFTLLAAGGAGAMLALGPGIKASQHVEVPIGWGTFVFGGGVLASLLATAITRSLQPEPLRLKPSLSTMPAAIASTPVNPYAQTLPAPAMVKKESPARPTPGAMNRLDAMAPAASMPRPTPGAMNRLDSMPSPAIPTPLPIAPYPGAVAPAAPAPAAVGAGPRAPAARGPAPAPAAASPATPARTKPPSAPPQHPSDVQMRPRSSSAQPPMPGLPPHRPSAPELSRAKAPSVPPAPGGTGPDLPRPKSPSVPPGPASAPPRGKPASIIPVPSLPSVPKAAVAPVKPPTTNNNKKPLVPAPGSKPKLEPHPRVSTEPGAAPPPDASPVGAGRGSKPAINPPRSPTLAHAVPPPPITDSQPAVKRAPSDDDDDDDAPNNTAVEIDAEAKAAAKAAKKGIPRADTDARTGKNRIRQPSDSDDIDESATGDHGEHVRQLRAAPVDPEGSYTDQHDAQSVPDPVSIPDPTAQTLLAPEPPPPLTRIPPEEMKTREQNAGPPERKGTPIPTLDTPPKLPISTAPTTLPPPKKLEEKASGPTPACPQCESPMAWVEEHLRFYCKSCRMYF